MLLSSFAVHLSKWAFAAVFHLLLFIDPFLLFPCGKALYFI